MYHQTSELFLFASATIESTMKIAQPVMITVAFVLISFVTYIYFSTILPYSEVDLFSPRGLIQTSFGLWVLFNIFFNYASCILSDPGGTEVLVRCMCSSRYAPKRANGYFTDTVGATVFYTIFSDFLNWRWSSLLGDYTKDVTKQALARNNKANYES